MLRMNIINKNKKFLICVFLIVIMITAYWNVKDCGYVFDDRVYVIENKHIIEGFSLNTIQWAFNLKGFDHWIPITWLSLMFDSHLFGINPKWQHITNLTFHIISCLFLFLFLNLTTQSPLKSLLIAALFAVHPLNVESVAWISERKNVLSTFFWMFCMLVYAKYSYSKNIRWFWYLITLLLFSLGLMSKAMLITLPFVFLLLDYWPLNRIQIDAINKKLIIDVKHLLVEKIPFLVLSFCLIFIVSHSLKNLGGFYTTVPLNLRILNAIVSYFAYFWKLIFPINLACFYPFPAAIAYWKVIGTSILLIAVSLIALKNIKKYKYLGVGWFWYLGTLIPVIGLKQLGLWGAIADRHAYIPQIGIFIIFIWFGFDFVNRWKYGKVSFTAIVFSIVVVFGFLTSTQVKYWKNDFTLFEHALNVTVNNYVAYNNVGAALVEQGNIEKAEEYFLKSLKIKKDYYDAHNNLGVVYFREGKIEKAIQHFNEVVQIAPKHYKAHQSLGLAYKEIGHLDKAIEHYRISSQLNPEVGETHNDLAIVLVQKGAFDEAIIHFKQALKLKPRNAEIQYNFGLALMQTGKTDEAIEHFRLAMKLQPELKRLQTIPQ